MATKLGELFIEIKAKFHGIDRKLRNVKKKFDLTTLSTKVLDRSVGAFGRTLNRVGRSIRRFSVSLFTLAGPLKIVRFGFQTAGLALSIFSKRFIGASVAMNRFTSLIPFLATGITALGVAVLKLASDAEEAANLFGVAFGNQATSMQKWADTHRRALGMGRTQIKEYLSTFQLFITSMGTTPAVAAQMSKGLTRLTADIASLRNVMPQEAFRRLSAGLAGEIEPLRRLGINVDDVMIKKFAIANGIIQKQTQELTQLQKMMIRYNIIVNKTRTDQGDFEKTSRSLKNTIVLLWVSLKDVGDTIGQILSPTVTKFLIIAKNWIVAQDALVRSWAQSNNVGEAFQKIVERMVTIFLKFKDLVVVGAQSMFEMSKQVVQFLGMIPGVTAFANSLNDVLTGTTSVRDAFIDLKSVIFGLQSTWINMINRVKMEWAVLVDSVHELVHGPSLGVSPQAAQRGINVGTRGRPRQRSAAPIGGSGGVPMFPGGPTLPLGAIAGSRFEAVGDKGGGLVPLSKGGRKGSVPRNSLQRRLEKNIRRAPLVGKGAGRFAGKAAKGAGKTIFRGLPAFGVATGAAELGKIAGQIKSNIDNMGTGSVFGKGRSQAEALRQRDSNLARERQRIKLEQQITREKAAAPAGFQFPSIDFDLKSALDPLQNVLVDPSDPSSDPSKKGKGFGTFSGMGFQKAFGGLGGNAFGSGSGRRKSKFSGPVGTRASRFGSMNKGLSAHKMAIAARVAQNQRAQIHPTMLGPTPGKMGTAGTEGPTQDSPFGAPKGSMDVSSLNPTDSLLEQIRDTIGEMGVLA